MEQVLISEEGEGTVEKETNPEWKQDRRVRVTGQIIERVRSEKTRPKGELEATKSVRDGSSPRNWWRIVSRSEQDSSRKLFKSFRKQQTAGRKMRRMMKPPAYLAHRDGLHQILARQNHNPTCPWGCRCQCFMINLYCPLAHFPYEIDRMKKQLKKFRKKFAVDKKDAVLWLYQQGYSQFEEPKDTEP